MTRHAKSLDPWLQDWQHRSNMIGVSPPRSNPLPAQSPRDLGGAGCADRPCPGVLLWIPAGVARVQADKAKDGVYAIAKIRNHVLMLKIKHGDGKLRAKNVRQPHNRV